MSDELAGRHRRSRGSRPRHCRPPWWQNAPSARKKAERGGFDPPDPQGVTRFRDVRVPDVARPRTTLGQQNQRFLRCRDGLGSSCVNVLGTPVDTCAAHLAPLGIASEACPPAFARPATAPLGRPHGSPKLTLVPPSWTNPGRQQGRWGAVIPAACGGASGLAPAPASLSPICRSVVAGLVRVKRSRRIRRTHPGYPVALASPACARPPLFRLLFQLDRRSPPLLPVVVSGFQVEMLVRERFGLSETVFTTSDTEAFRQIGLLCGLSALKGRWLARRWHCEASWQRTARPGSLSKAPTVGFSHRRR